VIFSVFFPTHTYKKKTAKAGGEADAGTASAVAAAQLPAAHYVLQVNGLGEQSGAKVMQSSMRTTHRQATPHVRKLNKRHKSSQDKNGPTECSLTSMGCEKEVNADLSCEKEGKNCTIEHDARV
jgi:hypothetical protein